MFVGHLALALAGKKIRPATSLAWLMAAVCLVDLIWPVFMLAGIEHARVDPGNTAFTPLAFDSYPWTHSLLMGIVWAVAFAALARAFGVSASGAGLIGVLVVSHWALDLITHRPEGLDRMDEVVRIDGGMRVGRPGDGSSRRDDVPRLATT